MKLQRSKLNIKNYLWSVDSENNNICPTSIILKTVDTNLSPIKLPSNIK